MYLKLYFAWYSHKQLLYRRINGNSPTIPVQLSPSAGLLLLQKHRHGTHNKHLGPLSRTCVNNELGYPRSSRVNLQARSGSVTDGGVCECQGTRAVNPPERHQSEGPRMLIGKARVHKWQIMTYKWEFMWPLSVLGDPSRDVDGAH